MKPNSFFRLVLPMFAAIFLLLGPISAHAQEVKVFVGDWAGAVSVSGMDIEIVCHFQLDADGKLAGTIDSPGQGAYGLKLANITVEGKKISFGIDDPNIPGDPRLEGSLDDTGTKISGDFSQGGSQGTFELTKQ